MSTRPLALRARMAPARAAGSGSTSNLTQALSAAGCSVTTSAMALSARSSGAVSMGSPRAAHERERGRLTRPARGLGQHRQGELHSIALHDRHRTPFVGTSMTASTP